ncbi:MAG TPA: TIGR03619 family F420-dependent LLM class oxidoreductase [Pseudonocardiaceae bacterium]
MIKLGFSLPQFGALASHGDRVAVFATEAERLGARSLWVGDRLIDPVDPTVGYGGGSTIPPEFRSNLDPFALLTVAATATREATLGTNVLNLPWYAPAVLARLLTTIDIVSGGRLLPGFGIGWSPEEYQAAGIPWQGRGARLDESLDALEALWNENPAEYHGKVLTLPRTHIDLKPVQRPMPIYLGGMSDAALRRIGRRGYGWLPACRLPGFVNADELIAQRETIRAAARDSGRSEDVPVVVRVNPAAGTSVQEIVDVVGAVAEQTDITDIFVDLMYLSKDVDEALDLARRLLDGVR